MQCIICGITMTKGPVLVLVSGQYDGKQQVTADHLLGMACINHQNASTDTVVTTDQNISGKKFTL